MPHKRLKFIFTLLAGVILITSFAACKGELNPAPASPSLPGVAQTTQTGNSDTSSEPGANTQIIVDMFGRRISVAKPINRVLCTGPVEADLVYLIAPDKLVGLAAQFYGDPPLVQDKYLNLPVIGAWYGAQVGNYETFMSYKPDIILEGKLENLPERQQKFGSIPVVGDDTGADLLLNFKNCITFIGKILDANEQASDLNTYYQEAMQYVNSVTSEIPDEGKIRVYYAEGLEGLNTDPNGSFHTNLVTFCGGINIAENIPLVPGYGMSQVSLENVLGWDPDIIILGRATPDGLYQKIMADPIWARLKAVKNNRVYVRPCNPFSIFDGPPGPVQILGMYWMIQTLYPERTQELDMDARFKEFYSKFLHYDLTDDEVAYLLDTQR